jgi:ribosomal protein S18 acetylase RimI-like enzyme
MPGGSADSRGGVPPRSDVVPHPAEQRPSDQGPTGGLTAGLCTALWRNLGDVTTYLWSCRLVATRKHRNNVLEIFPHRCGVLRATSRPDSFGRFLRLEVSLEEQHSRDIAKPHWYLLLLAVDPAYQSCGVGGRLMAPVLRKAEANAIPAYVQTLYEGSVAFYERHGFRVTSKTDPSRGEPSCWGMIRP